MAQSLGYKDAIDGNAKFADDVKKAAEKIVNDTADASITIAKAAGNVTAKTLSPAATITAILPGTQPLSLALTVADIAINGDLPKGLGATAGQISSIAVGDVLTDFGNKSPNIWIRVTSEVTSKIVGQKVEESVR